MINVNVNVFSVNEYSDGSCQETFSSTSYNGDVRVSNNNKTCQQWSAQTPEPHTYTSNSMYVDGSVTAAENKCRAHINEGFEYLWCYVAGGVRWESCGVPHCSNSKL